MCYFLALCFFFNDTATTEIYTLSLHDALPISQLYLLGRSLQQLPVGLGRPAEPALHYLNPGRTPGNYLNCVRVAGRFIKDRKSTRLNSSHANISYAVFCLKKKKTNKNLQITT